LSIQDLGPSNYVVGRLNQFVLLREVYCNSSLFTEKTWKDASGADRNIIIIIIIIIMTHTNKRCKRGRDTV